MAPGLPETLTVALRDHQRELRLFTFDKATGWARGFVASPLKVS